MNMELSKAHNPQKHCIKIICKTLYYLGVGDCWYEDNPHTNTQQWFYKVWMVLSNLYTFSFIFNEFLAHCRSDLNEKEKNDLVQFTLAHATITGKIICTFWEQKRIKKVLERLLESTRTIFVSDELDKACVKKSVRLSVAVVGVSYMALLTSTVDGIRAYFIEGIPIRTEVTYYPTTSETGIPINILRFFIQFHWWFIVTIMTSVDCLCICSLVFVEYKFKVYFNSLRQKVIENMNKKTRRQLGEEYRQDLVMGIKMHEDALWCAKNVQSTLGNLYSVQIFESVVLLVMCLIKLVAVERNMIFLLANFAYINCLIILTGAYMLAAADITHEASLVSNAMFHSGWELVTSRDLRVLIVLALQRSQVPVYMFAFGIMTLSYTNFISVIRSSYSFFAVMY